VTGPAAGIGPSLSTGPAITGQALPKLSIGLFVYNGERYLAGALGAFLDQTFGDFELIVSDNASTDRTEDICRAFAGVDRRIRYHRFEQNRGAQVNADRTVELAGAPYFKWAAHDDLCRPRYLEACLEVLDRSPDVVLCHSQSLAIDANDRVIAPYPDEPECMQETPHERLRPLLRRQHYCIPVFGVMRTAFLRSTFGHGDWVGSDRNLLAEAALRGKIAQVPEPLFLRRHHAESSISKIRDERARIAWYDPKKAGTRTYPTSRVLQEYLRSISGAALSPPERWRCRAEVLRWVLGRHHTGRRTAALLTEDLVYWLRLPGLAQMLRGDRRTTR
jgi:glycosyltransferase involved in cell wall biosynthesis